MHGLAMQPYTPEFAKARLTPQKDAVTIDKLTYRADIDKGVVVETGAKGTKSYRIEHVLGGKNVCYFLTSLDKGRLQTLPVAYDVNKKEWFDTAASGLRHFPGGEREPGGRLEGLPVHLQHRLLRLPRQPAVDQLRPEDRHLPHHVDRAGDQLRDLPRLLGGAQQDREGHPQGAAADGPADHPHQDHDESCSATTSAPSCHAKGSPLTLAYQPGERFYDHFDLATLEDSDFYPDGRDLGENYTLTSWSMSPCFKSGKIDCMHCHTSSGRYRFKKEKFNNACVPCHEDKVNDPAAHTHHLAEGEGSKCISCHMPKTAFARMNRSDHSMAPPAPAATIAYQSPNACNLCHADKDAAWADALVRQWRTRDYQAPVLARAALVAAARKRDWAKLPEMLAYIRDPKRDEVFATSLIRLIPPTQDEKVLLGAARRGQGPVTPGARRGCPGAGPGADHGKPAGPGRGDGGRVPAGAGPGRRRDRGIPADDGAPGLPGAARRRPSRSTSRPSRRGPTSGRRTTTSATTSSAAARPGRPSRRSRRRSSSSPRR